MRKFVPWLVVLAVARVVIDHYLEIDRKDRKQARSKYGAKKPKAK